MPRRQLTDDVTWVYAAHETGDDEIPGRAVHSSMHLVEGEESYLLINSGDYDVREAFLGQIREVVGEKGVGTIFAQESHIPNSANVSAFREEYDADIIFPGGASPIHGLPEVIQWPQYGTERLYGRTFDLTRGSLLDLPHTTWVFDRTSGVLFPLEGFCYYHREGETGKLSSELEAGIRYEDVHDFYSDMLLWLKYAEPRKVIDDLQGIVDDFDPSFIAPAHGNPIVREDIPTYMEHIDRAVTAIADSYEFKASTA
jgi:flavorubredoxin